MTFNIDLNSSYIENKINDLEKLTDEDRPYTRLVFSEKFYEARSWLSEQFNLLGLSITTDEAGNLIGLLKSKKDTNKVVIVGSHIDTVPSGGRYDGTAGVISGLCLIKHMKDNNMKFPIHLILHLNNHKLLN